MMCLLITLMSFTETASLGARTGEEELTEQQLRATSGNYICSFHKLFLSKISITCHLPNLWKQCATELLYPVPYTDELKSMIKHIQFLEIYKWI